MRRLENAADGRRFAVDVLRSMAEAGPERCRANLPPYLTLQSDALILALIELKERATVEAVAGFGQVMTDAIGTRSGEPMPEIYEAMERAGVIRRYKFKRAVNSGHRIAVPALWREQEQCERVK